MRKKRTNYSEETKLSLLRQYHESGLSKYAFSRLHGLSCPTLLTLWIKTYECPEKDLPLQSESRTEAEMAKKQDEDYMREAASLRKRVSELERALELSRLETAARDILIDKAEEYFNIPIRKKSGAKQ